MNKNTICLWYNGDAEAAARFYAETFPHTSVSRA
jgi:predicted 3-demethylubiquinone-9 3-methyltransferase (glyoxalase superfamily)